MLCKIGIDLPVRDFFRQQVFQAAHLGVFCHVSQGNAALGEPGLGVFHALEAVSIPPVIDFALNVFARCANAFALRELADQFPACKPIKKAQVVRNAQLPHDLAHAQRDAIDLDQRGILNFRFDALHRRSPHGSSRRTLRIRKAAARG